MGDLSPGIPDSWICLANPNVQLNTNMSLVRFKDSLGLWSTVCFADYFENVPDGPFPIYDGNTIKKYNLFYMKVAADFGDEIVAVVYRSEDKRTLIFDWFKYNTNVVRFSNSLIGKIKLLGGEYYFHSFSVDDYWNELQLGPDVIIAGIKQVLGYDKMDHHIRYIRDLDCGIDDALGFLLKGDKIYSLEQIVQDGLGLGVHSIYGYNVIQSTNAQSTIGIHLNLIMGEEFDSYLSGSILVLPSNTFYSYSIRYDLYNLNDFLGARLDTFFEAHCAVVVQGEEVIPTSVTNPFVRVVAENVGTGRGYWVEVDGSHLPKNSTFTLTIGMSGSVNLSGIQTGEIFAVGVEPEVWDFTEVRSAYTVPSNGIVDFSILGALPGKVLLGKSGLFPVIQIAARDNSLIVGVDRVFINGAITVIVSNITSGGVSRNSVKENYSSLFPLEVVPGGFGEELDLLIANLLRNFPKRNYGFQKAIDPYYKSISNLSTNCAYEHDSFIY